MRRPLSYAAEAAADNGGGDSGGGDYEMECYICDDIM